MGAIGQTFTVNGLRCATLKKTTIEQDNIGNTTTEYTADAESWSTSTSCYLEDFKHEIVTSAVTYDQRIVFDELDCIGKDIMPYRSSNPFELYDGTRFYFAYTDGTNPDRMVYQVPNGDTYDEYFITMSSSPTKIYLVVKTNLENTRVIQARFYALNSYQESNASGVNYLSQVLTSAMINSLNSGVDNQASTGGTNTPIGGNGSGGSYNSNDFQWVFPSTSGDFVLTKFFNTSNEILPVEVIENDKTTTEYTYALSQDVPDGETLCDKYGAVEVIGTFAVYYSVLNNMKQFNQYFFNNDYNNDFKMGSALDYRTSDDDFTNAIELQSSAVHLEDSEYIIESSEINFRIRCTKVTAYSYTIYFEQWSPEDQAWNVIDQCSTSWVPPGSGSHTGNYAHYLCVSNDKKFFIMAYAEGRYYSDHDPHELTHYKTLHICNDDVNELLGSAIVSQVIDDVNNSNNQVSDGEYEDVADGERDGKGKDSDPKGRSDEAPDDPIGDLGTGGFGSGLFQIFNPSLAELQQLVTEMNSGDAWTELKKFFTNDPMDGIVSLHLIPYNFQQSDYGTLQPVKMGAFTSNQTMYTINNRYVTFDFSSRHLDLCYPYHEFLNFEPHTKVDIHLPYIGVQPLNPNDVIGRELQLKYVIDILTGAVTAILYITIDGITRPRYIWSGSCLSRLPLTGRNHNELISSLMNSARTVVSSAVSGNPTGMISLFGASQGVLGGNITHGGALSSEAGWLGSKQAYIIVSNPEIEYPNNRPMLEGYPSNITGTVGQFDGYTQFRTVDLQGIPATKQELDMIEDLLKGGVYSS